MKSNAKRISELEQTLLKQEHIHKEKVTERAFQRGIST